MKGDFEKRLEATRRETREKVQRILEKRFQTQQQQMKEEANKATSQLAE
jgi:TATA-binding protein-associated factor Taf7